MAAPERTPEPAQPNPPAGAERDSPDLARVLWEELDEIFASRAERDIEPGPGAQARPSAAEPRLDEAHTRAHQSQLVGLAFSGGGIRSATFDLGVLQALARFGILRRVDLLSTVSGGGYIGSWLAGCLKRGSESSGKRPETGGQRRLSALEMILAGGRSANGQEPPVLDHLREYSNYLTPRVGLFGADTAQAVAAYLRNLLLNQLILVLALGALLALPFAVAPLYEAYARTGAWFDLLLVVLLAFTMAISLIAFNIASLYGEGGRGVFSRPLSVNLMGVLPFALACWLTGLILFVQRGVPFWSWHPFLIGASLLGYGLMWVVAPWPAGALKQRRRERLWPRFGVDREIFVRLALAGLGAGVFGGALLGVLSHAVGRWGWSSQEALTFGGPLVAGIFVLTLWLHVGLLGRGLREEAREWTARLVGTLALWTLSIGALFAVSLYGATFVHRLGVWLGSALTLGWVGTTLSGVLLGRGAGAPSRRVSRIAVVLAPHVFIAGLLLLVSVGVYALIGSSAFHAVEAWLATGLGESVEPRLPALIGGLAGHAARIAAPWVPTLAAEAPWSRALATALCAAAAFALALFLSWRVDVNLFSLHALYRNRLVRCYLGASNTNRRENRWTDIDPEDERVPVSELRAGPDYAGPYPLINTTLNLVAGEKLAWQRRKGTSFTFAPLYSGFDASQQESADTAPSLARNGYRPTRRYADDERSSLATRHPGVLLGTAMAISGAAASPNMGSTTSTPLAILMTVFNVRLGWWLGNPRRDGDWRKSTPSIGLFQLVREMLGRTRQSDPYVYLSDGGHFENLGIYELVRRRCRFIIACDAEQDGELEFGGLGTAIELCRTDFGVEIDIDVDALRRDAASGLSRWHCAIGRIAYDRRDAGGEVGTLVYLKSSLTGAEPMDVQRYAAKQPAFPHQSTADQWFDETQFESYRALGEHVARTVFEPVLAPPRTLERSLAATEALFLALRQRWFPPSSRVESSFTRHAAALNRVVDTIRSEPRLGFLEAQFYPEWNTLRKAKRSADLSLPSDSEALRQGFYVCSELIQLMESVYVDLDLEREATHPDNRGWMNLFRHWSWSSMFRVTWAVGASTYGARFQDWCERVLDMKLGRVEMVAIPLAGQGAEEWMGGAQAEARFTFLERGLTGEIVEVLRGPATEPHAEVTEIIGFDLVVEDPTALKEDAPALQRFPIGLALLGAGDLLYYFRIQDHLRQTGLGREALRALQKERAGRVSLAPRSVREKLDAAKLREPISRRQREVFERLFESVRFQVSRAA